MKAKTTDQTIPLRDRCLSHFAALRIPVEATALDELLTRAEKEGYSHLSFLDRLLGAEAGARRERAVARRIREPSFAESKTLEGFDWSYNPRTFDRVQMEELATGDFIRRRTNLLMVGWSGIGKSHIMQALGQNGLRARVSCPLPNFRSTTRRPHRFARRQDSSGTPTPLREPGPFDHRRIRVRQNRACRMPRGGAPTLQDHRLTQSEPLHGTRYQRGLR